MEIAIKEIWWENSSKVHIGNSIGIRTCALKRHHS
jgi:hypothetical protein